MRGINISWLIGTIAVAVLFISLIQVKWLITSLDLQKKIFDQSVEQLLNTVSHWILVEADFASLEINHESEGKEDQLIVDGLQHQSRAILQRMAILPMDSLFSLSLNEHGIETSVVFGAFDRYGQPAYLD